jgi:SAM-dependent methyltransferase
LWREPTDLKNTFFHKPHHEMQYTADYFDSLFAENADPWQFKSRWYESRKRALTLACLPAPHYASAFEPGCANGELSAALAPRCDFLLATDGAPQAVSMATKRLAEFAHVQIRQAWIPLQWPAETFDLIVLSEFSFYLNAQELDALAAKTMESLRPGGVVVACHWRRPIEGCEFNGDQVHQRLSNAMALFHISQLVDADMRLDVWSRDACSIAQREGFA